MKRLYYLDKLGWPVGLVKGRWFLNFLRILIHTRKYTFKRPSCLDPQSTVAIDGCTVMRGPCSEPNALTLETFEKTDRGEDLKSFDTVEELFEDLDN